MFLNEPQQDALAGGGSYPFTVLLCGLSEAAEVVRRGRSSSSAEPKVRKGQGQDTPTPIAQ